MVDIVNQLCIKSHEITAKNGDYAKAEQGKTYTTTVPCKNEDITVFSHCWFSAPKRNFVLTEE